MPAKLAKRSVRHTRTKAKRPSLAEQPYDISEGVSQSMLADWVFCRQLRKYKMAGWEPEGTTEALEYGSMFHFFLEHLYTAVRSGNIVSYKDATDYFETLVKLWRKKWAKKMAESSLTGETMEKMIAQADGVWPGYCKMWKKDFTRKVEWKELESVFDVDFEGYRLRGMCDGLRSVMRLFWLLETKTKGRWNQDTIDRTLAFDFQNLFYLVCGNIVLKKSGVKKPLQGVLYNIVRRPQIELGKDGSLRKYLARLRDDTKTRPNFYYVRREVTYTAKRQKSFYRELLAKLGEFSAWVKGDLPTYRNESACVGKYTCKFLGPCADENGRMKQCRRDGRLFQELEE